MSHLEDRWALMNAAPGAFEPTDYDRAALAQVARVATSAHVTRVPMVGRE